MTMDAVREAATRLRAGIDGLCSRRRVHFSDQDWTDVETLITAALDSRAGDAGEGLQIALDALRNYADPTGYTDNQGDSYDKGAEVHPGLLAQSALDRIAALSHGEGRKPE